MPCRIRRPWWAFLFAFTLIALTSLIFPCSGYCQGGEFDGDQKTEYYQQIEDGSSIWLNPNERYVRGSLRQATRPQQYYATPSYRPAMPSYSPPQYATPPAYTPPRYVPQPYYPQWQSNYNSRPYRPTPYGIDFGNYRRDCDTCGVKMDGLSTSPNYRNWSERRGAIKDDDSRSSQLNSLNEKRENDDGE